MTACIQGLAGVQNLRTDMVRELEGEGVGMTDRGVVIAGAGPTGLMLAGELALAGTDVALVERRSSQELDGSRSGGLHSRTIEVLDQRGIADRFLAEWEAMQVQRFGGVPLDISDFPTRHPYGLALWQQHVERILAAWVAQLGVPVIRRCEVTDLTQDDAGVDVALTGGRSLRGGFLVGCDGGRSTVRRASGIAFEGWDPTTSWLIAEVEAEREPEYGLRHGGGIGRIDGGGPLRIVLAEPHTGHTGEPTLGDLSEALVAAEGTDYGVHSPTWLSRFTDMTRQAACYRSGRVLLAGDAAHVHSPQGGQGLNIGLQDAVNLGWKLARVIDGTAPDSLLDTYHAERHPVGARVLRTTMAQVALTGADERTGALRDTVAELLGMDEPRRRIAGMLSGLDVHYDLGRGHPLLGRRVPYLDLVTGRGPVRVFSLLHPGEPVLIDFDGPGGVDGTAGGVDGAAGGVDGAAGGVDGAAGGVDGAAGGVDSAPWTGRVRSVDARPVGGWELPVLGEVPAPSAVLVRPDGYVAWVGDGTHHGLREALTAWFGPA